MQYNQITKAILGANGDVSFTNATPTQLGTWDELNEISLKITKDLQATIGMIIATKKNQEYNNKLNNASQELKNSINEKELTIANISTKLTSYREKHISRYGEVIEMNDFHIVSHLLADYIDLAREIADHTVQYLELLNLLQKQGN